MAIKALVVDDSALASTMIADVLASDDQITVVGIARDGQEACTLAATLRPDVITLDIWMPNMDGFAAVERIMAYTPTPILVVTNSNLKSDVQIGLRMLAMGALDVIEKPVGSASAIWERQKRDFINRVKLLAGVKVVTHLRGRQSPQIAAPRRYSPTESNMSAPAIYRACVIAASTGGPVALVAVLRALPANLPFPIFVAQHIPAGFHNGLAEWLQRETALRVRVAREGDMVLPGYVYIAPGGQDMHIVGGRVALAGVGDDYHVSPNADILMDSVSRAYGRQTLGVVLTGAGRDGAQGLVNIRMAGGYAIVQDEATSVVYGMPRAAAETGAAHEIVPLEHIGGRIALLAHLSSVT